MPKIASLAFRRLSIVLWVFFGGEGATQSRRVQIQACFLVLSLGLSTVLVANTPRFGRLEVPRGAWMCLNLPNVAIIYSIAY